MSYSELFSAQKLFFSSQQSKDLDFRKQNLQKLKSLIIENEAKLNEAIYKDFGKSAFETYITEIAIVIKDINYYLKHINKLASPQSVSTNMVNLPGKSRIYSEPLGCVLVIGAWNYPYQLSFCPLVVAMATGNCCILKPSELPANTMNIMADIINQNFDASYIHVVKGAVEETTSLLQLPFDKIFFTGSPKVGKIVYKAAAENLCPVILELGGKSPAIVTRHANLDKAAKRIVWGKFLNAGQTCVAPDYLLVEESIKETFIEKLKQNIQQNNYHLGAAHYTQIINDSNVDRLQNLIDNQKIILGGKVDKANRYIAPTLIKEHDWQSPIMQEEIFGPLLPILDFKNLNEAFAQIAMGEKPLSAYMFTDNTAEKDLFLHNISFGGGCINDVIVHLTNVNLPFGGVGQSGTGAYHGPYGFAAFSHQKSVVDKANWGEPNLKYPPYTDQKMKWIKKVL